MTCPICENDVHRCQCQDWQAPVITEEIVAELFPNIKDIEDWYGEVRVPSLQELVELFGLIGHIHAVIAGRDKMMNLKELSFLVQNGRFWAFFTVNLENVLYKFSTIKMLSSWLNGMVARADWRPVETMGIKQFLGVN